MGETAQALVKAGFMTDDIPCKRMRVAWGGLFQLRDAYSRIMKNFKVWFDK
jgi:hypothetical protein